MKKKKKIKFMSFDIKGFEDAYKLAVQPVLDQFQAHVKTTVTPVAPDEDTFELSANATPTV